MNPWLARRVLTRRILCTFGVLDFAANVLYVLSFIGSGDGGKEAGRLLGFLDLPNAASMEKYSFPCIQRRMSSVLERLCDEACMEALVEEVRVTM